MKTTKQEEVYQKIMSKLNEIDILIRELKEKYNIDVSFITGFYINPQIIVAEWYGRSAKEDLNTFSVVFNNLKLSLLKNGAIKHDEVL